jgi:hypothetical protein
VTSPTILYDITSEVLQVAWDGLQAGLPEPFRHDGKTVLNGPPAWDEWQNCGSMVMAWASSLMPTLPTETETPDYSGPIGCGMELTPIFTVSVLTLRCEPTIDDSGHLPSAEELDAAARLVYVDGWLVWQALICWAKENQTRYDKAVSFASSGPPEGSPSGLLAGWQTTVKVAVDDAACCGELPEVSPLWWPEE